MTETQRIAERITRDLTTIKSGSLRFWGHWFGRPYDNSHRVVGCTAIDEVLKLFFDQDETLRVWNPGSITISRETLRIEAATRVRWEWYSYGRPKTSENSYFEDFARLGDGISCDTNMDSYTPPFEFDLSLPAVEIL